MESSRFVHRANDDGIMDSICKGCFAIIATSMWEADLERAEEAHFCDVAGSGPGNDVARNLRDSLLPEPR